MKDSRIRDELGEIKIEVKEKSNGLWIIIISNLVFRKFNNEETYLCRLLGIEDDNKFFNNICENYNGHLFVNGWTYRDLGFPTKNDAQKVLDDIIYPILTMKQLEMNL